MAARSVASGVALQFGLISAAVSMTSAIEKAESGTTGNVLVCDAGHDPERITSPRMCPCCGEVPQQQLKKARPAEGGLVILTAEDQAALTEHAAQFKKKADVSAHPAEQVEVLTGVGEKMYFLKPDKGHEAAYGALLGLVENHPDLAFMTQWTPRSSASQFQVRVYNGVLVLQERIRAGSLREAPDLNLVDNPQLAAMAEQFLQMPGLIVDYDPETYADKSAEVLAEILKDREVVAVAGVSTDTVTPVQVDDLMAKLTAHLAQAAQAEDKPAPKKRTTRKPAAAKA